MAAGKMVVSVNDEGNITVMIKQWSAGGDQLLAAFDLSPPAAKHLAKMMNEAIDYATRPHYSGEYKGQL